jgi:cardiolipin synthase
VLNIPNSLTLLRIAAIPAILIALDERQYALAFALFVAAGVTDAIDGGIARMTNSKTELGAFLDPLADKGLVLSLLVKLTMIGSVQGWVLAIILTRDVVCLSGFLILFMLTGDTPEVRPSIVGKLATFLQILGLAGALLVLWRSELTAAIPLHAIFAGAAAATAFAGVQYVGRGLSWYQARPG